VGSSPFNATFYVHGVGVDGVRCNKLFNCGSGGKTEGREDFFPVRPVVTLKSDVKAGTSTTVDGITTWEIEVSEEN